MIKGLTLFITLLFLALPVYALPVYTGCIVRDGFNRPVQLKKPAKRIISLAPNVTEILFNIGAGSHIAGVVQGSDYPLEARKIRRIGYYRALDMKKIVAMHPDLMITWGDTFSNQLVALRNLGIPIYAVNAHQLEDIPVIMENLGCLTGTKERAVREGKHFLSELNKIRERYASQKPLTVFFQTGTYPLVTVNKNSWINQVITVCGGRNIFANTPSMTPVVSLTSVIEANPEVIITDVPRQNWKKYGRTLDGVHAIKNNWLFTINPDLIEWPSPRLLQGTEKVCQYLEMARAGEAAILAQKASVHKKISV